MVFNPFARARTSPVPQHRQEFPFAGKLGRNRQIRQRVIRPHRVNQHVLEFVTIFVFDLALIEQLLHEIHRAQFLDQGRIEGDFIDAVGNFTRLRRRARAFNWIDVQDDHIARVGVVEQRIEHRVTHVAAVPIVLAVNLHGLEQERQTCRCEYYVGGDLVGVKNLHFTGAHIGR